MKKKKLEKYVIKHISKCYRKENWLREALLILMIALLISSLVSIINIYMSRYKIEEKVVIKKAGTLAEAILYNGTETNYEQLQSLPDIEYVGWVKEIADWVVEGSDEKISFFVMDQTAYHNLTESTFEKVVGKFPQKSNEIMMSEKALNTIGINDIKVGMDINVDYLWTDRNRNVEINNTVFVLSGYYSDNIKDNCAYLSLAFAEEHIVSLFPADLLIKTTLKNVSRSSLENLLYNNITIEDDAVIDAKGTLDYEVTTKISGGYAILGLIAISIFLSEFLFLYNYLRIYIDKETREYGLLQTLGCTKQQIKKIIVGTFLNGIIVGCVIGSFLSYILSEFALPYITKGFYQKLLGNIDGIIRFKLSILLYVLLILFIGIGVIYYLTSKRVMELTPLEAYQFTGQHNTKKLEIKLSNKGFIRKLAYQNLIYNKRVKITFFTFLLCCETIFGLVIFTKGLDPIYLLKQNPDFIISPEQNEIYRWLFNTDQNTSLMDNKLLAEVEHTNIYGYTTSVDLDSEPLRIIKEVRKSKISTVAIMQIMSNEQIRKIDDYVKANNLKIDIDSVEKGNGAIIVHNHEISNAGLDISSNLIGLPIYYGKEDESNMSPIDFAGFLDLTECKLPAVNFAENWMGNQDTLYFYMLISESALDEQNIKQEILESIINVSASVEKETKQYLEGLIGSVNGISLQSNSDVILENEVYLNMNEFLMKIICIVLLIISLINYSMVLISDIIAREKIFALMKSVGMTKKQLHTMLLWENYYYILAIAGIISTLGIFVWWLMGYFVKQSITYFEFHYPGALVIMICLVLLIMANWIVKWKLRETS